MYNPNYLQAILIYIRDKQTGYIHIVGTDQHDRLYLDDNGSIQYMNLQNGGTTEGDYEFVLDEQGHNQDNLTYTEEEQEKYGLSNMDDYFNSIDLETYMIDFEQIHQLKLSLIEKGWDIEEKYSNDGFGKLVGYHIFARRCDWHGKFTYALTGHVISFCGICTTISDSRAMLATVQKLHDKCIQAWADFPDQIPFQTARNEIKADIIFQPFETAREYHVNDKRYYK